MKFKIREMTGNENRLVGILVFPFSLGVYYLFLLYIGPWLYELFPTLEYVMSLSFGPSGIKSSLESS